MLSIGLIGCGRVAANVHIPSIRRIREARIVAFAEPDEERRVAGSALIPGAIALENPSDLLDMAEVEAVVVCLPNELHAQTAVAAIERGRHVYLEKPIALSLEEAERVIAARERAGVIGMMGFNQRFNRLYRELREQIALREHGDWQAARTVLTAPEIDLPEWKRVRRRGGGALLDQASHHFDLARYLFDDEIAEVSAELHSHRSEDDTAVVNLRLTRGLLVQSFFSIHAANEARIEVYAERGRISVDRYRPHGLNLMYRVERRRAPARDPSFEEAFSRFVAAVRGGSLVTPSFEDGYRSLAAVLAADASARSGRKVVPSPMKRESVG